MRLVRANEMEYVPASHEDPKRPGVLKRVLATSDQMLDGHPQMINWAKLPVGSSFRRHYHEDMEEAFIIVRGTAKMTVNKETFTVHPGDMVVVAPREEHEMANAGDCDVEYIVYGISLRSGGKTVVV